MSGRDVTAELAEALRECAWVLALHTGNGTDGPPPATWCEPEPGFGTDYGAGVARARAALARFDAERASVESRPASPARLCAICGEDAACDDCGVRCVRCARLSRECC